MSPAGRPPAVPAAPPPQPRQAALGACIQDGRALLLLRAHDPFGGWWSLPGGKPEPGEGLAAACRRELAEELGCAVDLRGLRLLVDQTVEAASGGSERWLIAVFAFAPPAGAVLPGSAAWFPLAALPGLHLLPTDRRFLADAALPGPHARYRRSAVRLDAAGRPEVLAFG